MMFNFTTVEESNLALLLMGLLILWMLVSSNTLKCLAPETIAACVTLNTVVVLAFTILLQPVGALIALSLLSVYRLIMYFLAYTPKDCVDTQIGYASGEWATLVIVCLVRHLKSCSL